MEKLSLPQQSDNPDHSSTLPQADLNPLLNPVLAKNIGRWAEVYFTNPPEKRDRAVLELVRELEGENPLPQNAVTPPPWPPRHDLQVENAPPFKAPDVPGQGLTCESCGYLNRPKHKFCGRCGIRITPTFESQQEELLTGVLVPSLSSEYPESPIFGVKSTPRSPYRLYIGVALALVVSILGYLAWRAGQTPSRASHQASQAPPAVTNPVASTPPALNPQADTPPPTPSGNPPASSPLGNQTTAPTERSVKISPAGANLTVPPTSGENKVAPVAPLTAGGSEELALARDFLNGTNGKQQNRALAVPWLWKAVAKQNVEATVLLSDLYLRGDGVAKNCDQARLLLDAAALKGRKDAAIQLQNLRAFGCE